MGQKVHPKGMRIGIIRSWDSNWYAGKKDYAQMLHREIAIRDFLKKHLKGMSVSHIELAQANNVVQIKIHTSKPGLIIGQQGAKIEELKDVLKHQFNLNFSVDVIEIRKPALNAHIVAEGIAKQVERRIPYRRAAKASIEKATESGAKGIKISLAGRLNGVEIARREFFSQGKIPLHTLRADIDYAFVEADTTYGKISVKVWIYQGEVFNNN